MAAIRLNVDRVQPLSGEERSVCLRVVRREDRDGASLGQEHELRKRREPGLWPSPAYPLLPKPMREWWGSVEPSSAVLASVGLPKGWTLEGGDRSVWDLAERPQNLDALVLWIARTLVEPLCHGEHKPLGDVPLLAQAILSETELDSVCLSPRVKNALRRTGRLGDEAWFAEAGACAIVKIRNLGARSVLELSCVLEETMPPDERTSNRFDRHDVFQNAPARLRKAR